MRPFGAWSGRLAMAGACLAWAGCGGGNVPDPDSDSSAASESAPRVVDRGAGQAPAEAPPAEAPAPVAGATPTPAPEAVTPAPAATPAAAPSPAPTPEPTAAAEAPAPTPAPTLRGDASGTEEMLKIASASTPAPTPASSSTPPPGEFPVPSGLAGPGTAGPAASAPGPAAPGPAGPGPATPGSLENMGTGSTPPPINPNASGPTPPASAPGPAAPGPGQVPGPNIPTDPAAIPGPATPPGSPSAMPDPAGPGFGNPAGSADPNGSPPIGPGTFNHPGTAVMAFLAALTAKDKDRLSQATARRAPTEAVEKHRKIFAAIVEQSISDDELDEMSKALTGFRVVQILPAKSTGRIGVLIGKMEGRDRLQRTLTVRKEKEGWKVMDISDLYDFKPGLPPIFMRGGRRR